MLYLIDNNTVSASSFDIFLYIVEFLALNDLVSPSSQAIHAVP